MDIDPRWEVAIDALLAGATQKQAAEAAGVHRNTLRTWMQDPRFRGVLAKRADEVLAEVKLRRAVVATRLVDRLARLANEVLDAAERDPGDRRAQRAARAWLANYRKVREQERLDAG